MRPPPPDPGRPSPVFTPRQRWSLIAFHVAAAAVLVWTTAWTILAR